MKTLLLYSDDFGKSNGTASRYVDVSIKIIVGSQKSMSIDSDENFFVPLQRLFLLIFKGFRINGDKQPTKQVRR
jgi:hypothetical protein